MLLKLANTGQAHTWKNLGQKQQVVARNEWGGYSWTQMTTCHGDNEAEMYEELVPYGPQPVQ